MIRIVMSLMLALAIAGCAAHSGELSERRSNCFGKLKPGAISSALVAVPKS